MCARALVSVEKARDEGRVRPPEVGAALDAFAALVVAQGGAEGVRCLDVGTGTGCVAFSGVAFERDASAGIRTSRSSLLVSERVPFVWGFFFGNAQLAVRIAAEARRLGKRCVVVGVDVSEAMLSRAVADEDVSSGVPPTVSRILREAFENG